MMRHDIRSLKDVISSDGESPKRVTNVAPTGGAGQTTDGNAEANLDSAAGRDTKLAYGECTEAVSDDVSANNSPIRLNSPKRSRSSSFSDERSSHQKKKSKRSRSVSSESTSSSESSSSSSSEDSSSESSSDSSEEDKKKKKKKEKRKKSKKSKRRNSKKSKKVKKVKRNMDIFPEDNYRWKETDPGVSVTLHFKFTGLGF